MLELRVSCLLLALVLLAGLTSAAPQDSFWFDEPGDLEPRALSTPTQVPLPIADKQAHPPTNSDQPIQNLPLSSPDKPEVDALKESNVHASDKIDRLNKTVVPFPIGRAKNTDTPLEFHPRPKYGKPLPDASHQRVQSPDRSIPDLEARRRRGLVTGSDNRERGDVSINQGPKEEEATKEKVTKGRRNENQEPNRSRILERQKMYTKEPESQALNDKQYRRSENLLVVRPTQTETQTLDNWTWDSTETDDPHDAADHNVDRSHRGQRTENQISGEDERNAVNRLDRSGGGTQKRNHSSRERDPQGVETSATTRGSDSRSQARMGYKDTEVPSSGPFKSSLVRSQSMGTKPANRRSGSSQLALTNEQLRPTSDQANDRFVDAKTPELDVGIRPDPKRHSFASLAIANQRTQADEDTRHQGAKQSLPPHSSKLYQTLQTSRREIVNEKESPTRTNRSRREGGELGDRHSNVSPKAKGRQSVIENYRQHQSRLMKEGKLRRYHGGDRRGNARGQAVVKSNLTELGQAKKVIQNQHMGPISSADEQRGQEVRVGNMRVLSGGYDNVSVLSNTTVTTERQKHRDNNPTKTLHEKSNRMRNELNALTEMKNGKDSTLRTKLVTKSNSAADSKDEKPSRKSYRRRQIIKPKSTDDHIKTHERGKSKLKSPLSSMERLQWQREALDRSRVAENLERNLLQLNKASYSLSCVLSRVQEARNDKRKSIGPENARSMSSSPDIEAAMASLLKWSQKVKDISKAKQKANRELFHKDGNGQLVATTAKVIKALEPLQSVAKSVIRKDCDEDFSLLSFADKSFHEALPPDDTKSRTRSSMPGDGVAKILRLLRDIQADARLLQVTLK